MYMHMYRYRALVGKGHHTYMHMYRYRALVGKGHHTYMYIIIMYMYGFNNDCLNY